MKDWLKPRTVFAFMFYGAFLYILIILKKEPPEILTGYVSLLLGFYFGNKSKKGDQ